MRKTVLVAEDDAFFAEDLGHMLEAEGFDILHAHTGDEVLSKLTRRVKPPDLVLLDIRMPPGDRLGTKDTDSGRITGLVVARTVRRKCPALPLLGFSVCRDPDVVGWFRRYGAGYIVKPATVDEILDAINSILFPRRKRRSPKDS